MKILFFSLVMVVWTVFNLLYAQQPAYRVDFYRYTGNGVDSIHKPVLKTYSPQFFSQSMLVDENNYGHFRVRVVDEKSGLTVFRKGYNSLSDEWPSTDEGRTKTMAFEESFVFPACAFPFRVIWEVRKGNDWEVQKEMVFGSKSLKKTKYGKYKVEKISGSADSRKALDILIIPEGYTSDEMEKFKMDAQKASKSILECKPFDQYSASINVTAVMAPSAESGTDFPQFGVLKNTLLDAHFNTFGTERYLTSSSYFKILDVAANATYDKIIVLVNTPEYGGAGFYNFITLVSAENQETPFLIIHEFGHDFAGLADEYYSDDVAVSDYYDLKLEPWEPNITTLVDFGAKWKDMLSEGTPVPTPIDQAKKYVPGVYEGAGYSAKGIYRPVPDCSMKSVRYNDFCPVCRRALVRAIEIYTK